MLSAEEDKDRLSGIARKRYLRSVSWTDRSPTKSSTSSNPRPQVNSKARSLLPPLSITRRNVEEWPKAGSDDLGIWPHPQTPRGSVNAAEQSSSEQAVREFQFKRDKLAFFDKECSRIDDHIYLGSEAVARNREVLRQNGITHVLNCVGFVCPEYFKIDLVYKTLWLQDSPSEDITSILYDVFDYFEDVREQGGRVFVHCCQGVSRSTSLVIAYLMWKEGQSFEEAFQYVKAARGVTNPNMGFACQLLQCQKRVHAVPASPNSMLRMYRMAPHSPYAPLHLVPKTVRNPGAQALDSRGAFVVHVPSALYVWSGKNCNSVMSNNAREAAFQVIRYERANGPISIIKEGEEPPEFWEAFATGQPLADKVKKEEAGSPGTDKVAEELCVGVGKRMVDEYNLDFELFHKALAGGVVPPFPVSSPGSETCLPARENGWGRLRRKFAIGLMKELATSSKSNSSNTSDMVVDSYEEEEKSVSLSDPSSPLSPPTHFCGSPDSFECFPNGSPDRIADTCEQVEHPDPIPHPLSPASCVSLDSLSYFPDRSPTFSSKSPTLSPSTSDYASSFSFSPSSSNWSDLSYLSSQQPSPSGLDSVVDPFPIKNISLLDSSNILNKENSPTCPEEFYANYAFRVQSTGFPGKEITLSLAERRGSNPPPRMLLSSVDESPQVPRNLVRSWSFSTPDIDDDEMKDFDYNQSENEGDKEEEVMLDADIFHFGNELRTETEGKEGGGILVFSGEIVDGAAEVMKPVFYKLPSLDKIEEFCVRKLDSRSAYVIVGQESSLDGKSPRTVTFWFGRETLHEKELNCSDTSRGNDTLRETIVKDFLNQMDLPLDTPVQVVREGEEPERFLNQLRSLALQVTEYTGHG